MRYQKDLRFNSQEVKTQNKNKNTIKTQVNQLPSLLLQACIFFPFLMHHPAKYGSK